MKISSKHINSTLPTIMVIFGATGDLMRTKLVPSLFSLWKAGRLPVMFQIIGFSKDTHTEESFRQEIVAMLLKSAKTRDAKLFSRMFVYQEGMFNKNTGYDAIATRLGRQDAQWNICANKLFYLAVPPQFYEEILHKLDCSGLTEPCSPQEGWTRVIVEKPFGRNLKNAQTLDMLLGKLFKEKQIYRMDHYLGKETVQNIIAFRFSNSFLEPSWNANFIERVHVRFLEKNGIGARGVFYDGIGALRDVGQNHILQMTALMLMNRPKDFTAESIRQSKARFLRSLVPLRAESARGQYEGYLTEKNVAPDSVTETYFRIKTHSATARWKNVPIILEGGKGIEQDDVSIKVVFRHLEPCLCEGVHSKNVLKYEIKPQERIRISLWVKAPGNGMHIKEKDFIFDYKRAFTKKEKEQTAYEKLLLNVIEGDQTSFVSTKEMAAAWKFVDPYLEQWQKQGLPTRYLQGSNAKTTINK